MEVRENVISFPREHSIKGAVDWLGNLLNKTDNGDKRVYLDNTSNFWSDDSTSLKASEIDNEVGYDLNRKEIDLIHTDADLDGCSVHVSIDTREYNISVRINRGNKELEDIEKIISIA